MYQVIRKIKGFYYVAKIDENIINFNEIYECKLKGILKKNNSKYNCIVGDYVEISEDKTTIIKLYERKNLFERPLISNIDNIFLVFSITHPNFDFINFQKIMLYIDKNEINRTLILTKCDLVEKEIIEEMILKIKSLFKDLEVIEKYKDEIPLRLLDIINKNKNSLFTGPSGVGKSTILKTLLNNDIETQEISAKLKRGKNTTVESRFYNYNNHIIIDTPGFSNIFFPEIKNIYEIYDYFRDFSQYECKFKDCKHLKEIECGIKKAVEKKEIDIERYNFYKYFMESIEDKKNKN